MSNIDRSLSNQNPSFNSLPTSPARSKCFRILFTIACFFLLAFSPGECARHFENRTESAPLYERHNNIARRIQWNENNGYCGEMSLISAGLFYGQYLSQFDVRAVVNVGMSQDVQVLLGTPPEGNADKAAAALSLNYELSNDASPPVNSNPKAFLSWVKQQVLNNHPVAIGVYANQCWFNEDDPCMNTGDGYDHIIPITGWGSNHPLTDLSYYPDDIIYMWDNGFWTGDPTLNGYTSSTLAAFQKSRKGANSQSEKKGNVYSLPNDIDNYAIAIQGVADLLNQTVPLRVDVSLNEEIPEIVDGSSVRPARSESNTVTITASELEDAVIYNLYKYDDLNVPTENFNANSKGRKSWQITSALPPITDVIPADPNMPPKTSSIAIYRAVKASAP